MREELKREMLKGSTDMKAWGYEKMKVERGKGMDFCEKMLGENERKSEKMGSNNVERKNKRILWNVEEVYIISSLS